MPLASLDVQGGLFSSAGANVAVSSGSTANAVLTICSSSPAGVTLAKEIDFGGGFNATVFNSWNRPSGGERRVSLCGGWRHYTDGTGTFTSS